MIEIDSILVPLDFSRASKAALVHAGQIAARGTEVSHLHVVERWPQFMQDVLFPYAPLGEDAAEIEHELVEAARAALRQHHGFGDDELVGESVKYGPLRDTLIAALTKSPANLVVAGATGESGARPNALGRVAEQLVQSAARPVMLVRGESAEPIKRIAVALDLTEGDERVFEVAARLAQRLSAELDVLHVLADPLADDHVGVVGASLKFDRVQIARRSKDRIEAMFDRLFRNVDVSFGDEAEVRKLGAKRHVRLGEPASQILEQATKLGSDLIVVGAKRPGRPSTHLGHVASSVLRRSMSHVCVVPFPAPTTVAGDD